MKKVLKIIFITLGSLIGLFILSFVVLYICLSNHDYQVPYEVYNSEESFSDVLEQKVSQAIENMGDDYYLDVLLTSDDFNELLYGIIIDNLNKNYKPTELDVHQHYVYRIPYGEGPILEDGFTINHIYSEMEEEQLTISVCFSPVTFFKTKLKLFLQCETLDNKYAFQITKVRIGKLTFKQDSKILKSILDNEVISTKISSLFTEASLPIIYDEGSMRFEMEKEDFYEYLKSYLANDNDISYSDQVMIDILANPQYDVLDFYTNNGFGIGLDLSNLKPKANFDDKMNIITEDFNKTLFIKNKTSNILLNSLLTNDFTISITENELAKILYAETNGFSLFTRTISVGKGLNVQFKISAIFFEIDTNKVNISIQFDIEGIKTIATIETTPVSSNNGLTLFISDYMTIGEFRVHSMFFIEMLELALDNNSIFKASTAEKTLSLDLNSFSKMLNIGSAMPKFTVANLVATSNALSFKLTALNQNVNDMCLKVTNKLKQVLGEGNLDYSKFDMSTSQQHILEEVKEAINDLGEKINSSTATNIDTTSVVSALDNLNLENQEVFIEMIEEAIGDDITDLYSSLFN